MLGDLSARVDWSYAPDFIKAFQDIIQLSSGDDFIISRGEAHSVEEFVDIVFDYFNLDYTHHVTQDSSLLQRRLLTRVGDCSKLKRVSGWTASLDFYDFVRQLVIDSESLYKSKRL
jgi:GDPmannose 4,6-dehydratase